jgi:hypothetical protein
MEKRPCGDCRHWTVARLAAMSIELDLGSCGYPLPDSVLDQNEKAWMARSHVGCPCFAEKLK